MWFHEEITLDGSGAIRTGRQKLRGQLTLNLGGSGLCGCQRKCQEKFQNF